MQPERQPATSGNLPTFDPRHAPGVSWQDVQCPQNVSVLLDLSLHYELP
jgi:hypothetical protein